MTEKLDDLANHVDDAIVSADELENDPGTARLQKVERVKVALEKAKDTVDEMEDAEE
jgi:hypothetical protein